MELHLPPPNARTSHPKPDFHPNLTNNTIKSPIDDDIDSSCSTPYVSAPSSPGRGGFFYSCPTSPMHSAMSKTAYSYSCASSPDNKTAYEFEFSARFGSSGSGQPGYMSSADELFLNGQIRPMKLSTHLERPQVLAPLMDLEDDEEEDGGDARTTSRFVNGARGRDPRVARDGWLRRRARSLSPLRSTSSPFNFLDDYEDAEEETSRDFKNVEKVGSCIDEEKMKSNDEETAPSSSSTSRSSSAGRNNSKRWVFLKDFLYRSKSEGRSNNKFWSNISLIPTPAAAAKEKRSSNGPPSLGMEAQKRNGPVMGSSNKKPVNGLGKRWVPPPPAASPHELHYKASRAQAEEMRKRTFLPYRQGLLGCLGFSSKGYGAMSGFAKALNPVSSR